MVLMADPDPIPQAPKKHGKLETMAVKKLTGLDINELEATFDVSSRELAAAHAMLMELVDPQLHIKRHAEAIRLTATGPGGEMAVNGECVFRMVQVLHALKHGATETAIILTTHGLR